jgi:large subunit ribosomal protein L15
MAIGLNNLHATAGSTHKKKRVGRGPGSGLGKTAGRGNKGQKSRSGYSANIFKKQWIEVSLASLEKSFEANEEVTPELMHERGVIAKGKRDVVVLGTGDISKALRVSAHRFTKSAREKIESAGGAVTVIEKRPAADGADAAPAQ